MAIAWKALPVWGSLEKVDRRLDEIEPFVAEALAEVRLARQGRNLPEYLDQKLSGLEQGWQTLPAEMKQRMTQ